MSQPKPQRTRSILKQAHWILQLLQAKLSQAKVVQYFEEISHKPHAKIAEKETTLWPKTKGSTQGFSNSNYAVDAKASNIKGVSSSSTYIVNTIHSLHEY